MPLKETLHRTQDTLTQSVTGSSHAATRHARHPHMEFIFRNLWEHSLLASLAFQAVDRWEREVRAMPTRANLASAAAASPASRGAAAAVSALAWASVTASKLPSAVHSSHHAPSHRALCSRCAAGALTAGSKSSSSVDEAPTQHATWRARRQRPCLARRTCRDWKVR